MKSSQKIVLFIDRNVGKKIISQALKEKGECVEVHDDHFAPDEADLHWLTIVGAKDWIVLSKDERIASRILEKRIVSISRVRLFVLVSRDVTGEIMAQTFIKALPSMKKILNENDAPFIAKVYGDGVARMWKNKDDLSGF